MSDTDKPDAELLQNMDMLMDLEMLSDKEADVDFLQAMDEDEHNETSKEIESEDSKKDGGGK